MSSAAINMSTEQLTVKGGKSSAGKKVTLLLIFLVLVLVLSIIFLALYVTSNKKNEDLESKIGKLEDGMCALLTLLFLLFIFIFNFIFLICRVLAFFFSFFVCEAELVFCFEIFPRKSTFIPQILVRMEFQL